MQFKELEIKPQGSRFKRLVKTPHFRKTLIAVCAGAGIGFLLFYMTEGKSMETMPVSKFKATCLAVLEDVKRQKKKIVITKYGKPIVEIAPILEDEEEISLKDSVLFIGDILSPVAEDDWEALK